MSEKLPYPADPLAVGDRGAILGLLALCRLVFFPRLGKGLHERVADLEARLAALEAREP